MTIRDMPLLRGLLAAALAALAGCATPPAPPVVATEAGTLQGVVLDHERAYLGIRYAEAPSGARRWQPPVVPTAVSGPVDATKPGPHCPQVATDYGLPSSDEDCLFLNVYVPDPVPHGSVPVMVWIHGGALVVGEGDDFDPAPMVRQAGVIVVTLNYRLGALGWLAHKALDGEGHNAANYGLMDQQAALAWVHRNIGRFGGDPGRVTLFGESAGGLSVLMHLAAPGSAGLFQRAIVESGVYAWTLPTLEAAEAEGTKFAESAGCPDQTSACLRALPVGPILDKESQLPIPPVDGRVLVRSLDKAFESGMFARVPVLQGTTHDEFRVFVAGAYDLQPRGPIQPAQYQAAVAERHGAEKAAKIVAEYPLAAYPSPDIAAAAIETDAFFACPAWRAEAAIAKIVPSWEYEFSDPAPPQNFTAPAQIPYGAYHASEIQFLLDVRSRPGTPPLSPAEQALSRQMIFYWTNFARTGNPNGPGLPAWPGWRAESGLVETLAPPAPAPETGFAAAHHCAFWTDLAR